MGLIGSLSSKIKCQIYDNTNRYDINTVAYQHLQHRITIDYLIMSSNSLSFVIIRSLLFAGFRENTIANTDICIHRCIDMQLAALLKSMSVV